LGIILGGLLAALFLFDQPTLRAHIYGNSEEAAARVFRNMLLSCAFSGGPLGLAIGISIAYAWKRFIVAAGQHVETWMFFTITSTWVGVTCTFIGLGISDWYGAGLPLIILIVGMFSGILIGLPQSLILWSSGRQRLAWVISHSIAVIIGTILIVISGARDLIVLVVLLASIWAAYGVVMGLIFNMLRYSK
jgi:hypothetical protein